MRSVAVEVGRQFRDAATWTLDAIVPALTMKEVSITDFEQMLNEVIAELNKEATPDYLGREIMIDKKVTDKGSVCYAFHFVASEEQFNSYEAGDAETFFLLVWMPKSLTSPETFAQTIRKDRAKRRLQTSLQKYLRSTGRPEIGWNS